MSNAGFSLKERIFSTEAPASVVILRLVLNWIFIREGAQKLFGAFGGGGPESIIAYFKELGIIFPRFNAYLVGNCELLCGIAFLLGLLVRPAAIIISIIMIVAIFTAHRTGGFNYPLLIIAVCVSILQLGAGRFSLDRRIRLS